ncbi:MAG: diguanylate cyclase [Pseudomonas sp.]
MTLRKRLFWLFAPLLVVALGVAYALSQSLILSRFDRQDQLLLDAEAERLRALLDHELKRNLDLVQSYAKWDDSYEFMHGQHPEFQRRNMDPEALRQLNFDFMVYLDLEGRVRAEQWIPPDLPDLMVIGDQRPSSHVSLRRSILSEIQHLRTHSNLDRHGQLLLVEGVPLILATGMINTNQNDQPDAGMLVAGHFLDGERTEGLQGQLEGVLRLLPSGGPESAWRFLPTTTNDALTDIRISPRRVLDDQRQQLSLLFSNSSGAPQLLMEITTERAMYHQGRKAIALFLGQASAAGLVAWLLIYLGLDHWILRRVLRMKHEITHIGPDSSNLRLSDDGHDELGQLAGDINHMLERLEQSETRDREILDAIQDGYFELDARGQILTVNRALCQMLGYCPEDLLQCSFEDVLTSEDAQRARELFSQALALGENTSFAAPLKRRDDSWGYYETRFSLIHDAHGHFTGYRGILRDITDQVAYQNQLLDMAYRDPLTGLGNRKAFVEQLRLLLDQSRHQQTQLSLLYMDLDRFKEVNDRFGHDVGDSLLQSIAERLRNSVRKPDRVYRLGGDEFTMILPDSRNDAALRLSARLLAELRKPLEIGGQQIDFVTPSIGIAYFPEHADNPESLVKAADSAMYQAKQERNRSCVYQADTLSSTSQNR